jgi:hypothetical protein
MNPNSDLDQQETRPDDASRSELAEALFDSSLPRRHPAAPAQAFVIEAREGELVDATFGGFAGQPRLPFRLVSLSGGGYRAALFHAGVMRALHAAGELDTKRYRVAVNAVSGGVVPAMLWRAFLSRDCDDDLWPERALLDLVTRGPMFPWFGRMGLYFASARFRDAWFRHVFKWWEQQSSALTFHGLSRLPQDEALVMCELLDFEGAEVWALHRGLLMSPDEELFKYGMSKRSFYVYGEEQPTTPAEAIFRATAFPIFFKPWQFSVERGHRMNEVLLEGSYHLIDAGLIDNLAMLPFLPLITSKTLWTPQGRAGSSWYVSDAGAPMNFRDEGKHIMALGRQVVRTTSEDRALRLLGDIGQRLHSGAMYRLIRSGKLVDRLIPFHADTVPEPTPIDADGGEYRERPWYVSRNVKSSEAVASLPTSLAPMDRHEALAVLVHGAQLASTFASPTEEGRSELRRRLLKLS